MDYYNIVIAVSVLAFCLLLLLVLCRILRSHINTKYTGLKVENIAHMDSKRKLMKLDFEGKRYLILLGNNETVLDKAVNVTHDSDK